MLKEYKVEFELKVNEVEKILYEKHHNIFHFTIDGDHSEIGYRQPALWLQRFDNIRIGFAAGIDDKHDYYFYVRRNISIFQNWMHIVISQQKDGEQFWFRVYINGEMVHEKINTLPREYSDMKLYLSDPWYPDCSGLIRNMYLEGNNP